MHTNRGTGTETNVPRTSLPCPPRYGNSIKRWFAKALGANHPLVYYRSGDGSTGLRQVRPPLLSHTILTRETGTRIHPYCSRLQYCTRNTRTSYRIAQTLIYIYTQTVVVRNSTTFPCRGLSSSWQAHSYPTPPIHERPYQVDFGTGRKWDRRPCTADQVLSMPLTWLQLQDFNRSIPFYMHASQRYT